MDVDALAELMLNRTLCPALSVAEQHSAAPPPERLYHFTSAAGLLGMAASKAIWASLSSSLNDASELTYAHDLALQIADSLVTDVHHDLTSRFAKALRKSLDMQPLPPITLRVFVASFCESADASSQWLHYGRNGMGFALEFRSRELIARPFFLMRVSYAVDEQRRLISEILRRVDMSISEVCATLGVAPNDGVYTLAAHMAALGLQALAPALKSPAFESEREWRLATFEIIEKPDVGVPLPTKFRAQSGRIIPYVERTFDSEGLPLTALELGHSCPHQCDDDSLKLLLPLPIRRSSVPVRP